MKHYAVHKFKNKKQVNATKELPSLCMNVRKKRSDITDKYVA